MRVAAAALATVLATSLAAQSPSADSLRKPIPVDPQVRIGTLPNGLRYYIRANKEPQKRAELRLAIKAGSILEDDDQRGLAHFLEHMAFNGTKRFARNALVSYLESIGMRFGPDINAGTSFDETTYQLQIPTDRPAVIDTALMILEDWSRDVSLEADAIDKERGVVVEEWRLGRGAGARMLDKQLPVLLRGSRYAVRLPIGDKTTLETAKPEVVRRFYRDWYRPDLMAVIAVGDFDPAQMEQQVRQHFGDVPATANPRARTRYGLPDHDSTLVAIASDKEATGTSVAVYVKVPKQDQSTLGSYRSRLIAGLFTSMLNQRLFELTQKPDAPYIGASASQGNFLGDKAAVTLAASVKEDGIARGLDAILTETARVQRFGFTQTELDRRKQDLLRGLERAYAEREKTESASHAEEYITNFTDGEPIPGIAFEFELAKQLVPSIQLAELNRLASEWTGQRNRVITVNAPEKAGLTLPNERQVLAVAADVAKKSITAYTDAVADGSLLPVTPRAGTITRTETTPEIGVTTWTLSNGVRVMFKPTDFKADQILVHAYSPGGTSLLPERDFAGARAASLIVTQGGIGRFNRIDLQKALTGKAVGVSPSIGELSEEVNAQASPKDVETLFQLMHLYFTAPRADSAVVLAFKQRQKAAIENRGASPEAVFSDTLQVTLTQHHPRTRPISAAIIDSLDLNRSLAFYRDRFGDASDFTFVIVGNFSIDSLRPFVLTYLASLPANGRVERWRDVGVAPPRGVVRREVKKGAEPKSLTQLIFSGLFEWSRPNRYVLSSLAEVLRLRLRDVLREDLGGTYGVDIGSEGARDPRPQYQVAIGFGSDPARAEQLTQAVFAQIDSLKRTGPTAAELEKVREIQRREYETGLRENSYWISALSFADQFGEDARQIPARARLFDTLTVDLVRTAARTYLDIGNYVQVRLVPEK